MLDHLERLLPLLSAAMGTMGGLWRASVIKAPKRPRRGVTQHAIGRRSIVIGDQLYVDRATIAQTGIGRIVTNTGAQAHSSPMHQFPDGDELQQAAEEAARRPADEDDGPLPDETRPLSTDEEQLVAKHTADTVNLTLARLFVRLGPPPLGTNGGDLAPVSSGDGGSAR